MIIPVRCFTCNKVLADAWEDFVQRCQNEVDEKDSKGKQPSEQGKDGLSPEKLQGILKDLGFTRICCKRHMLSHVDLVEHI